MSPPLAGVRVLDLTRLLPGAVCTLQLADLGADVIKVEDTREGDYARGLGLPADAPRGATSALYRITNRNKRSLAVDLKAPAGRDLFLRLARDADALVEGFRPGVVDKLGIGYRLLCELNPAIVYCSISGYGQTGPYREHAGHDVNYLGYAGVLDQTGGAHGPPVLSNVQMADLLGGTAGAAIGILAALYSAQRTGRGRYIDVAMTDGALAHNIYALHTLETTGRVAPRGGDLLTGGVPCYGVYATSDGRYLAVGALEAKFWRALCEELGRPDLVPRQLATGAEGESARAELAAIFAGAPLAHWVARLGPVDCCVTPVLGLDEALADAHVRARGMIVTAPDGGRQYAPPFQVSGHRFEIARPAPAHGEHTAELLREAGCSDAEMEALAAAGTIRK